MHGLADWFVSFSRLAIYFLLTLLLLGLTYTLASGNRSASTRDLPQDYASARAVLAGDRPYQTLSQLYEQYGFPPQAPDVIVKYNPHPPVAILIAVPFALLPYDLAARVFVWSQLSALALTWVLGYWMFQPPVSRWWWSIAGGSLGVWAPVWQGVAWGQPVGFLTLSILAMWHLANSRRSLGFGTLLALTILVRPFVAILAVLACVWSHREMGRFVIAGLVAGLVPFAVLRVWPGEWLRAASFAEGYIEGCGSIPGVLHLGTKAGMLLFGVGGGVLAYLRYRALSLDATAALALTTAMLLYPLAWFQYDTCLLPVVAWVLARVVGVESSAARFALWGAAFYMVIRTMPDLMPTPDGQGLVEALARNKNWLQVIARAGILLGAVIVVARMPESTARLSRQK